MMGKSKLLILKNWVTQNSFKLREREHIVCDLFASFIVYVNIAMTYIIAIYDAGAEYSEFINI